MAKQFLLLVGVIFLYFLLFVSASRSLDGKEKIDYAKGKNLNLQMFDFTTDNLVNIFNSQTKDAQQLIAHISMIAATVENNFFLFSWVDLDYYDLKLHVFFNDFESKMENSYSYSLEYVKRPQERRKDLEDAFSSIPHKLKKSIKLFLSEFTLHNIRSLEKNCSTNLSEKNIMERVNPYTRLFTLGIHYYVEFERQGFKFYPRVDYRSFKEFILNSASEFSKRLDHLILQCQPNFEEDMKNNIEKIISTENNKSTLEDIASTLLKFLETEYSRKKWIVVVVPRGKTSVGPEVTFTKSGKFRIFEKENLIAIVFSINRADSPVLQERTRAFLKNFKFPLKYVPLVPVTKPSDLYEYFNHYIAAERQNNPEFFIETLVIRKTCRGEFHKVDEPFIFLSSNNTEFVKLTNNDTCKDNLVLAVPVRLPNQSRKIPDKKKEIQCFNNEKKESVFLRNEYAQAYLTMRDDKKVVTEPIILERDWKNTTGQNWRFLGGYGYLVNNIPYCQKSTWLGGVSNCNEFGNNLYRHGLQIINRPTKKCLVVWDNKKIGFDKCHVKPGFLWYDWHRNCEDFENFEYNSIQEWRNEFSGHYLSLGKNDTYATHKPWNNQTEQDWSFTGGRLQNSNGKCLAGVGWTVQQSDCSRDKGADRWSYNEKRQLISGNGYCLAVSKEANNINVIYDFCNPDSPEKRWWP